MSFEEGSKILDFYSDRSILITGGTGFVGKVLIEKLLRTCTSIATIFVIIRPKRNKQPQERLQELLACRLFDVVRQQDENLLDKVVAVEGDVERVSLGLSESDLARIEREVSVVYNVAATVKFNEPLRKAIRMNIVGTRNVVEVCRRISKLIALVHVSTAYANYELEHVDERLYPIDMEPDRLIKLSELLDDSQMDSLQSTVMKNLPNTYVFTKKQAEWLLMSMAGDLPVVICRPSIISATWREPFPGWVDNANASTGVLLYQGLGHLRTMFARRDCLLDLVPVDKVVAMIISLGWFVSLRDLHKSRTNNILSNYPDDNSSNMSTSSLEVSQRHQSTANLYTTGSESSEILIEKNTVRDEKNSKDGQSLMDAIYRLAKNRTSLNDSNIQIAQVPVFHCTASQVNPLTNSETQTLTLKYWLKYPSISTQLYPTKPFTHSRLLNRLYRASMQTLPAFVEDLLARLMFKKTNKMQKTMKFHQMFEVLEHFGTRSWSFRTENDMFLRNQLMTNEDKRLFGCNLAELDWEEYFENYVRGMREFVLKESWETLQTARRRMRKVYIKTLALRSLLVLLISVIVYIFTS